ncbi:Heterogeneous nuclear ribonucleoprotein C [Pseudolycoriella hygida]|uniref:Heterogeneous nuclear ribonucleoprotein C n=1 Tax=Pseudolycoriella hygida TaxID=35572 RepID=A0A9Q0MPP1_9DIPT|nr:Heterogeneous nuclear ribonucleoprotein C [Pseudolycoriella hygida]
MKMSKLSNQTNSQDPQAVNSRVFVGNLNTFQCSKTDVERMFQKYGRLAGISMHKGYAFVQFTNPFDARNACHGEDGRTILSQLLDVNMVAEPKPHQIGRKRQNVTKTGNDWDYYYDSYYTSQLFPTTAPRPIKRQRLMTPQTRGNVLVNAKVNSPQQQQQMLLPSSPISNGNNANGCSNGINGDQNLTMYTNGQQHLLGPFKVYSNPDTLICGNCRECFLELGELLDHKRSYCKLRFTCKCQENIVNSKNPLPSSTKLLCAVCKDDFSNPWDLMVHSQAAHMINIYELGNENTNNNNNISKNGNRDNLMMEDPELSDNLLSPRSSASKEEKEGSLSGDQITYNLTSSPNFSQDDNKISVSPASSRDSSPRPDSVSPTQPACIMRTLSIETTPESSLGMVASSISLTIAHGTIASK